jgi:hypothetical protein
MPAVKPELKPFYAAIIAFLSDYIMIMAPVGFQKEPGIRAAHHYGLSEITLRVSCDVVIFGGKHRAA